MQLPLAGCCSRLRVLTLEPCVILAILVAAGTLCLKCDISVCACSSSCGQRGPCASLATITAAYTAQIPGVSERILARMTRQNDIVQSFCRAFRPDARRHRDLLCVKALLSKVLLSGFHQRRPFEQAKLRVLTRSRCSGVVPRGARPYSFC